MQSIDHVNKFTKGKQRSFNYSTPENAETSRMVLSELATKINGNHKQATIYARNSIEAAWLCGLALNEAKSRCKYGEWGLWLKDNVCFGYKQASRYMKISVFDIEDIKDMSLKKVLQLAWVKDHPEYETMEDAKVIPAVETSNVETPAKEAKEPLKKAPVADRGDDYVLMTREDFRTVYDAVALYKNLDPKANGAIGVMKRLSKTARWKLGR